MSVFMKGADHLAHNVNKALYLIFQRFNDYFYKTVDDLDKEAIGKSQINEEHQVKLRAVATEVMEEFNAKERRVYIDEAFHLPNLIKDNVTLKKGLNVRLQVIAIFQFFSVTAKSIRNLREMIKDLRLKLLDVCDQSLLGFQQMIESYKIHRGLRKMPDSLALKFHPEIEGHRYSLDNQDDLVELAEQSKEYAVLKYFVREIQVRLTNPRIENLSTYVVKLLTQIETQTNSQRPEKSVDDFLKEINLKFT